MNDHLYWQPVPERLTERGKQQAIHTGAELASQWVGIVSDLTVTKSRRFCRLPDAST